MEVIYQKAASIILRTVSEDISTKNAFYESLEGKMKLSKEDKQVYAIVSKVQDHKNVILSVINKYLKPEYDACKYKGIFLIALYEILWNHKKVTYFKQISRRLKPKLKQVLGQIQADINTMESPLLSKPKYIRINRLLHSEDCGKMISTFQDSTNVQVKLDKDVPDLLVVPQGDLSLHDLPIPDTHLIVQDKASCLPPFLLYKYITEQIKDNPKEITVVDACAAPGNKTLQLMQYFGNVVAVEKDGKRYETLKKRLEKYANKESFAAVKLINADFRSMTENNNGDYILVDTSCSGTGNFDIAENDMVLKQVLSKCILEGDYERAYEGLNTKLKEKIRRLSSFQKEILSSALSCKGVKGVVYSTCSIFPHENEEVVKSTLEKFPDFRLVDLGDTIGHVGLLKGTIRMCPKCHLTGGFFVALFVNDKHSK